MEEKLNVSRIIYKSDGLALEGLIMRPDGPGKFPAVVFIHGHGGSAWQSILTGYFLTRAGFAVFLPSMMGYGLSAGDSDFNGPKTIKGVLDGIKIFFEKPFVDQERLGIWGVSRGATVAALITTKEPELFKAAVFQAGAYEMKRSYDTKIIKGIKENIEKQAGTTPEAFRERSPIYDMERVACPILIIHGLKDENIMVEQAEMLDEKLTELGKVHKTVILPESDHHITMETRKSITVPFLKEYLE